MKDFFNPFTAVKGVELNGNALAVKEKTNGALGVYSNEVYVEIKANSGLIVDSTGSYVDLEATNIDFNFSIKMNNIII